MRESIAAPRLSPPSGADRTRASISWLCARWVARRSRESTMLSRAGAGPMGWATVTLRSGWCEPMCSPRSMIWELVDCRWVRSMGTRTNSSHVGWILGAVNFPLADTKAAVVVMWGCSAEMRWRIRRAAILARASAAEGRARPRMGALMDLVLPSVLAVIDWGHLLTVRHTPRPVGRKTVAPTRPGLRRLGCERAQCIVWQQMVRGSDNRDIASPQEWQGNGQ